MHPKTQMRRPLLWGLTLAAGLCGLPATAQPPGPRPQATAFPARVDPRTGAIMVPVGGVSRFNPAAIDPTLVDPKTGRGLLAKAVLVERADVLAFAVDPDVPGALFLNGLRTGTTRIRLQYDGRPDREFLVVVTPDYDLLRELIRKAAPTASVEVTPAPNNVVVLSGYATTPQEASVIERLANSQVGGVANSVINAMQIGGVQQVQIDVVVASVDRNEVRSRGFDFFVNGSTFKFNSIVSGLIGSQTLGLVGPATVTPSADANLQFGIVPAQFFGALRALRTEGLAKFLAEPRVVTQTGRPAQFLAGGRQAVLSASSGINGPGVSFETVGITLDVLPIVYGNNQIWLEVSPSNRQVNQGFGITTVFGTVPGFTEQSIRCAIMLESGQTFAIGGLIQNSVQSATAKVPVLGDLPYVGTLFSSIRYSEQESELVILVTPRLVHPMDCNQVPRRVPGRETRSPDDYELFLENVLEAPRGQRKVWNGKCYNAPYKCDPTVYSFPCIGNLCTGPGVGGGSCGPNGCGVGGSCGPTGCAAPGGSPMMPGSGPRLLLQGNPHPMSVISQSATAGQSPPGHLGPMPTYSGPAGSPQTPTVPQTDSASVVAPVAPVDAGAAPLPTVPVIVPPVSPPGDTDPRN